MIRVAHISDSHFDERHRLEDNIRVHEAFIAQAIDAEVDLIVHSGDVYERKSTPAERNAAISFFQKCAGVAPTVIVRGNHDAPGDLLLFERVLCRYGIRVFEQPSVQVVRTRTDDQVCIVAVPWLDRGWLAAQTGDTDQESIRTKTIDAAERLLQSLSAQAREAQGQFGVPTILVGHLQVQGSETSTGQQLVGSTVELTPATILEVGAQYAALGHIHKAQHWHDGEVCYAGSPQRHNFGEPEAKGWRLGEIDDNGQLVASCFMELPAREIVLIERDWTGGVRAIDAEPLPDVKGALVRVRARVRAQDLHLVDAEVVGGVLRDRGAEDVKVEISTVHETRARCSEIAQTRDTWEKVQHYLEAKQIELDEEQADRLKQKLAAMSEHEKEQSHAAA